MTSWDEWLARAEEEREKRLGPLDARAERSLKLPVVRRGAHRPMSDRFIRGGFDERTLFPRVPSRYLQHHRGDGAEDAAELAARVRLALSEGGRVEDGRRPPTGSGG